VYFPVLFIFVSIHQVIACQDYHRTDWPVSGAVQLYSLIQWCRSARHYNTLDSPILRFLYFV